MTSSSVLYHVPLYQHVSLRTFLWVPTVCSIFTSKHLFEANLVASVYNSLIELITPLQPIPFLSRTLQLDIWYHLTLLQFTYLPEPLSVMHSIMPLNLSILIPRDPLLELECWHYANAFTNSPHSIIAPLHGPSYSTETGASTNWAFINLILPIYMTLILIPFYSPHISIAPPLLYHILQHNLQQTINLPWEVRGNTWCHR